MLSQVLFESLMFSMFAKQEEAASRCPCRTWSTLAAEKNNVIIRLNLSSPYYHPFTRNYC